VQLKVVASVPELGLMATDVMDGAVLPTVTEELVTAAPEAVASVGVAVQVNTSPLSNEAPVIVCVVTEGEPLTLHCQV
jgi:hypothetical protein